MRRDARDLASLGKSCSEYIETQCTVSPGGNMQGPLQARTAFAALSPLTRLKWVQVCLSLLQLHLPHAVKIYFWHSEVLSAETPPAWQLRPDFHTMLSTQGAERFWKPISDVATEMDILVPATFCWTILKIMAQNLPAPQFPICEMGMFWGPIHLWLHGTTMVSQTLRYSPGVKGEMVRGYLVFGQMFGEMSYLMYSWIHDFCCSCSPTTRGFPRKQTLLQQLCLCLVFLDSLND